MSYTFAIGDIHGCLDKLKTLIGKIEAARPGGTVVFLGDYVDRGPDSKGVIDFIMAGPSKPEWKWIALKGNHEDMMDGTLSGVDDPTGWLMNGGRETLDSYGGKPDRSHVEWISSLALKHSDANRVYAHADMDDSVPFEEQREAILLWSRKPAHYSGTYWGKHFVHGHTPSHQNPMTVGNRTNLDSGAVFGGKLSCAVFHDDTPGGPLEFIQA